MNKHSRKKRFSLLSAEGFASPHPVSGAEVNSLCKVVALVEAAVVGPGEGDHKLPRTLIGPVHLRGKYAQKYN